ncbi:MAG: phage integrase N-terminal SAM-like domain-containing protein [Nitrospinae bacterium]|nr:phage integrase N-terminal SAM-like domain-containing protein [Nitrospinota bacterium]
MIFHSFVSHKEPKNLKERDLQDFLSFLVVETRVSSATQN